MADNERLVSRDIQLAQIEQALNLVIAGKAVLLEFRGDLGMGKTTLLLEACRRSSRIGMTVASGRVGKLERDLPLGVFVDALDDHLAAVPPGAWQRFGSARVAEQAGIFPSLVGTGHTPGVGSPGPPAVERYCAHRTVRALLEWMALLSENTVETHLRRIFARLGVSLRTALAVHRTGEC